MHGGTADVDEGDAVAAAHVDPRVRAGLAGVGEEVGEAVQEPGALEVEPVVASRTGREADDRVVADPVAELQRPADEPAYALAAEKDVVAGTPVQSVRGQAA